MNDIQTPSQAAKLPATQAERMLSVIAEAALNPNVDTAKMRELLQLQRELIKDSAEAEFNQAYHRLISKLPRIKKDGTVEYALDKNKPDGPKRKAFSFATWENIDSVIRPLLLEEGFTLSFTSEARADGGGLIVTGYLMHIAGFSRKASIVLKLDNSGGKNDIQGMGSTFSYGKRYVSFMLLNIVTEGEDDDGIRGGLQFITAEQAKHVHTLIAETKTNPDTFLQTIGRASVEGIQKGELDMALNMLMTKKRQQAEKAKTP